MSEVPLYPEKSTSKAGPSTPEHQLFGISQRCLLFRGHQRGPLCTRRQLSKRTRHAGKGSGRSSSSIPPRTCCVFQFRDAGLGFSDSGLVSKDLSLGVKDLGLGFQDWVWGSKIRVRGLEIRVWGIVRFGVSLEWSGGHG